MANVRKLGCIKPVKNNNATRRGPKGPPKKRNGGKSVDNYICVNGQKIELTEEQTEQIERAVMDQYRCSKAEDGVCPDVKLAEVSVGEVVKVGGYEMIVLEQLEDSTAVICKDLIGECSEFGENNNYDGSYVDEICNSLSGAIADAVGEDNLLSHMVDLTSDDGLKDYGTVMRRVSLLTAELYRRYVEVLDKFKPDRWWWLATPYSTPGHENSSWIKCVAPSGFIDYVDNFNVSGVRPFCILKSDIFVSH